MKTDINDSNWTIIGVKPEPIERSNLLPNLQSCYEHSPVKIDHQEAESGIIIKEEDYDASALTTTTTNTDVERNVSNDGIATNDIKIKLDLDDNNDLLNLHTKKDPREQPNSESHIDTHANYNNTTHMNERYECKICSRHFKTSKAISKHKKLHTNERNYKCEICSKSFTTKEYLLQHVRAHAGKLDNKCKICGKSFTTKYYMLKHVKTHTGERNYKCDVCNKRFITEYYMLQHVKAHTDERNYKCEICNKRFVTKHNLSKHVKTHTGERNYKCDVCNKRFATKQYLARHVITHTGEKNYKCEICKKRFKTKRNMLHHMKRHADEQCEICGQRFRKRTVLLEHMKNHLQTNMEGESLQTFSVVEPTKATTGISEVDKLVIKEEMDTKPSTATNQSRIDIVIKKDEPKPMEILNSWQTLHNEIIIKEEHITNHY